MVNPSNQLNMNNNQINLMIMNPINTNNPNMKNTNTNSGKNTNKKKFVKRQGDWKCPVCKNINFGFRILCNRCFTMREKKQDDK